MTGPRHPRRTRVVITGGPHAGKTTLLDALAARGFATVPEAALLVIQELNATLGVPGQIAWRRQHPLEFQARITHTQLRLEAEAAARPASPIFFDRGVLDGWAYCTSRSLQPPTALIELEKTGRYDRVFVLETITPYSGREETGRISDEATSRRIGESLIETYRKFGYDPELVPAMTLEKRLELVIDRVGGG